MYIVYHILPMFYYIALHYDVLCGASAVLAAC